MRLSQLRELARFYSIQVTYEDATGTKRNASRDALIAALRMRIPKSVDLRDALRDRKHALGSVDGAVHVVWGPATARHRPRSSVRGRNDRTEWELRAKGRCPPRRDRAVIGRYGLSKRTRRKEISLPGALPAGYHVLATQRCESL